MKIRLSYIGLVFLAIISMASSCEIENDFKSVSGLWHCDENNPYITSLRNYEITINRTAFNLENEITIYNFFDLGDETETIGIMLNDSTISLKNGPVNFSSAYVVSGTGKVNKEFDRIDWVFYVSVNGTDYQDVYALFYR